MNPPKIMINDTHMRKPATRVQVKQTVIGNNTVQQRNAQSVTLRKHQQQQQQQTKFKPLVEVDPTIVLTANKSPLRNPHAGDYLLSKTASTEGIASKKSLELKKRYLLGETAITGVSKSDSASALDNKFKSFHSNITECQKLLNPTTEISPSMQAFLRTIDQKNEINKNNLNIEITKESKEQSNSEEKENRSIDSNKKKEFSETINTTLIENKLKSIAATEPKDPIETIDLVTPEKGQPIVDLTKVDIPKTTVENNKKFVNDMEKSMSETNIKIKSKLDSIFVDLTASSPVKDRSLVETNVDFNVSSTSTVPDIISNITALNGNRDTEERSRSPVHETTIEVPQIWNNSNSNNNNNNNKSDNDVDTDSLSNSCNSSSSLEDIPHFILDSTTSPETQNEHLLSLSGSCSQAPRLEVRDTSGELMQIDSLMIIDGQYIGDPADLELFEKLPDQTTDAVSESKEEDKEKTPVREIVIDKEATPIREIVADKEATPVREVISMKEVDREQTPTRDTINNTVLPRPILKFDTKNENKIDTLKNLPLILPKDDDKGGVILKKPSVLRFSDKLSPLNSPDTDKTPIAGNVGHIVSDSENDVDTTGPGLTETELSDWAADDAVSENFVDIEFALNSNKGTMKRNKKNKIAKNPINSIPEDSVDVKPAVITGPVKDTECGILKNLALDEIEFMDTGSENESFVESVSSKNKILLKNCGYVEFVENSRNSSNDYNYYKQQAMKQQKEQLPVIEAVNKEIAGVDYIEQGACILNNDVDLKTPMNEIPSEQFDSLSKVSDIKPQQLDSLNTIENCDDIDDDSLLIGTDSKCNTTTTLGTTTTTEESELLTIVTSPLESPPKNGTSSTTTTPTTPTNNTSSSSAQKKQTSSSYPENKSEETAEMGYEEYVKSLQAKIAQISSYSGRDSLENRKSRRKLSNTQNNSIDKGKENVEIVEKSTKIEPAPTLSKKLEEISKERVKQKDIIHDLVMDKLQAKKQLNAEKRLNRSRNRTMFLGNSNNSLTSPSSNVSLTSAGGTSSPTPVIPRIPTSQKTNDDIERRHSIHTTPSKLTEAIVVDPVPDAGKLNKTQSFCVYSMKQIPLKDSSESGCPFKIPPPPPRQQYRLYDLPTTEVFKQDARDCGHPDEKMMEIRKKYSFNNDFVTRRPSASRIDRNKSDDVKFREMKLSVSKSYNDISLMHKYSIGSNGHEARHEHKRINEFVSDSNLVNAIEKEQEQEPITKKLTKAHRRDSERRKSLIQTVSEFFHKKKDSSASNKDLSTSGSPSKEPSTSSSSMFSRFRISPKSKESKEKAKEKQKEKTPPYERCRSENCLKNEQHKDDEEIPPPIPPLPLNYQKSDDESYSTQEPKNELKKLRAITKASRQAELKRLRIAQEIKREQDEIEVQIKELETRGVEIEKALRGEGQDFETMNNSSLSQVGRSDEVLLKELLEIWRHITQLKKRDEELSIRQQELQLEHRHAELKEELHMRLSCSKLDKSGADVAIEGAILNEMLEIVAKRAALRPLDSSMHDQSQSSGFSPNATPNSLMQKYPSSSYANQSQYGGSEYQTRSRHLHHPNNNNNNKNNNGEI